MTKTAILFSTLIAILSAQANAEPTTAPTIFGQSLMSSAEIADHKAKLSGSVSTEDRLRIQTEHQHRMIQRARWKGLVIQPKYENLTIATND